MIATDDPNGPRIKGWHVLAGMIVFFGIIFFVNGIFLYQALSTHTGVIATEPYRKGLAYNERIAADEQQRALGWSEDFQLSAAGDKLVLKLSDAAGRPIAGLRIAGLIGRPSTTEHDVRLELSEPTTGIYEARFAALDAGTWMVNLEASELTSSGEHIVWRARKRLWRTP